MKLPHGPVGAATAALAIFVFVLGASSASAQQGLLGEYYDSPNLTGLVTTRIDPTVDFTTWGTSPTGTAVMPDGSYAERWTGYVFVDESGPWTFSTLSNDGVRMWVDGVQIIDNWNNHPDTVDDGLLTLDQGWYPLQLEHYQAGGGVVIQLFFAGPGQSSTIIPSDHLAVVDDGNTPPIVDAGEDIQVLDGVSLVALTGTAEDFDGHITDVLWTQVSGPAVSIVNPDQLDARALGFSVIGPYGFRLTASDELGAESFDEVTVTVVFEGTNGGVVTGVNRVWQPLTIDFPSASYIEGANPNPFLDRRLEVTFTHLNSGDTLVIPGYFAADGNAANTGADTGSTWRVRFTANRVGNWRYQASFRGGSGIAVDDTMTGTSVDFDGDEADFKILPSDPTAPGFFGRGQLQAVGEHYMVYGETGRPFFKVGANSPENFLAYVGFDQTPPSHSYAPHEGDWNEGDPTWGNDSGKGIIGALNYLGSKGINAVYFLTFNEEGDGDDVWPWTSEDQRLRFDCSKLDQWEIVFSHMDRLGILMHVVTQETENDNGFEGLNFGGLGVERRLYYRELIARFAHHPGVIWNMGEENTNTTDEVIDYHDYFRSKDAYGHPVVVHTYPDSMDAVYGPLLAQDKMQGASLQVQDINDAYARTLQWRLQSAAQGTPWIVSIDEHGPPNLGAVPDFVDPGHAEVRRYGLWANMMAGGAGCEWYFGFAYPDDDLTCEDWSSRDRLWDQSRYAKEFFEQLKSPLNMEPADQLVSNFWGHCLAWPGRDYAIFLPIGGTTTLDLEGSVGTYFVRWYDPRQGGDWLTGTVDSIQGPGIQALGNPPYDTTQDWAVRVELKRPAVFRERTGPGPSPGPPPPAPGSGG
ncbi:MAG: hypothetical protein ACI8QZ_000932 [Chlamydiales bacterium]|jgi:hypothetical protein